MSKIFFSVGAVFFAAAGVLAAVPDGLRAQDADGAPISRLLSQAGEAYANGDGIGALDILWQAQEVLWRKAPLGIRNVAFVTEPPENFGHYRPKTGERFQKSEPLILYFEPIGFTQLKEGEAYRYSMTGAFEILDSAGRILGGQKNLGPYARNGYRTFSTETMLTMTIGVDGLPAGQYVLRVALVDNLDQTKSVHLDKPFVIAE